MSTALPSTASSADQKTDAYNADEGPAGGLLSAYLQTTVGPDAVATEEHLAADKQHGWTQGNQTTGQVAVRNPGPKGAAHNASPDKIVTTPTGKSQHDTRSPQVRSARFTEAPSVEQSPNTTRMSTVPEDEVVAPEEQKALPRKSVQFSREEPETNESAVQNFVPIEDDTRQESTKVPSLYSRLRALASSQASAHGRTMSGLSFRSQDASNERSEAAMVATLEDDNSDADADEESGAESAFVPAASRKKRKVNRPQEASESMPSSPRTSRPELNISQSSRPTNQLRPFLLPRRITDPDMVTGVSEDEGRRNLERSNSPWTPRHPLRGLSHSGGQRSPGDASPAETSRRPLNLLGLHTGTSRADGDATPPDGNKPPRRKLLAERGTTLTNAKWRQLKHGIRALTQSKKKERLTQDQQKSAELLAELAAGSPAALMLASVFQRDEHGNKRIPALLEQLKVSVTDSEVDKTKEPDSMNPSDRHLLFRIELEYGNGINRMKWVVQRSLRDFVNLHAKYKLHYQSEKLKGRGDTVKNMPKFPKNAFPIIQGIRGLDDEDGDDDPILDIDATGTDTDRPGLGSRSRTRNSFMLSRRRSSLTGQESTPVTPGGTSLFRRVKDNEKEQREKEQSHFRQRQRTLLEIYLQRMIKFMLFRADANRLCKFLEVSALGMRLASEGTYHGKEGFLVIRSAKGLDFRKSLRPNNVKNRHTPKWFLVRHSYIVCVDSPEGMHVYDVFLFDSDFRIQSSKPLTLEENKTHKIGKTAKSIAATSKEIATHPQHHRLKLVNSERRLKLLAKNERVLFQFEESIRSIINSSPWCQDNRFGSFAPVRTHCFAQWLVDGRDYMWVVSRALDQAKDVIYIHDWWLSPELYMRRPAAISQKWRLDRILRRKAEQGVKIFVIVYRNIDAAVPIDSQYTKFSLLDLHENVFVQRSPNQFRQNTFFWAHHEKLCIVDHTVAFVGGIDLCFGRWDTPQHTLTDDKPTGFDAVEFPKDGDHCQLWPGKDYSNPRIQDFYSLNKPYEEMYNRSKVARMPWHDVSMQIVGQPARDLTRHFVQRWNYILRQRKPTRPTPFLLPPPDFNPADLEALGLDGTCEVQLLRSAGPWSIGTPDKTEHSIMNAYVKMIEESEHFVYMENQFFITSCVTEGATVYNKIGDALVERITRAAHSDEVWKATIIIPLIPGFQNTVEEEGGTSVRLIMQYQYRSICRGESSIFGRLRARGIDPEEYIQFYALRQWGKLGPKQNLVTEQLYIHAKLIIVDDRIALIGSANINERSQLGNRDSEVAAVVRDTDMLWSTMNGKPYRVGRYAHSLRIRLMREHLGLDVDKIMEDAQVLESEHGKAESKTEGKARAPPRRAHVQDEEDPMDVRGRELRQELLQRNEVLSTFNHDVDWEQAGNPNLKANRKLTEDSRVTGKVEHRDDVQGKGIDNMSNIDKAGFGSGRDTLVLTSGKEILLRDNDTEGHHTLADPRQQGEVPRLPSYVMKIEAPNPPMPPRPGVNRIHTEELGLTMLSQLPALPEVDDSDIGGPSLNRITSTDSRRSYHPLINELRFPLVDRDCMQDPIHHSFAEDTWHTIAENNTKIYRAVFRCMPDNQVRDWNDYHEYVAYEQRFQQIQGNDPADGKTMSSENQEPNKRAGPPGISTSTAGAQIKALTKIPTDIEKAAGNVGSLIKDTFGDESKIEDGVKDKEELQKWAVATNFAQMQRQGSDLSSRTFPAFDEKQGLKPVPEDETLRPDSQESETAKASSSEGAQDKEKSGTKNASATNSGSAKRRRRTTTRSSKRIFSASDDMMNLAESEELLGKVQGHLIEWPYDWLESVEAGGRWLFPFDQISPIEIYI